MPPFSPPPSQSMPPFSQIPFSQASTTQTETPQAPPITPPLHGGTVLSSGSVSSSPLLQSYHHSTPQYHNSTPQYHHSAPQYHHSTPQYHHSTPQYHHSTPQYHHSAPQYHNSAPQYQDHQRSVYPHPSQSWPVLNTLPTASLPAKLSNCYTPPPPPLPHSSKHSHSLTLCGSQFPLQDQFASMHLIQQRSLGEVHPESDVNPGWSPSHSNEGSELNEGTGYSASINKSAGDFPFGAIGDDAIENQPASLLGYLAKVRTHPNTCLYILEEQHWEDKCR